MVVLCLFNFSVSVPMQNLLPLVESLPVRFSTKIRAYRSSWRLWSLLSVWEKSTAISFNNLLLNLFKLVFFIFYLLPKSGFFDHIDRFLLLLTLLFDYQTAVGVEMWFKTWVVCVRVFFFTFLLDLSLELINFFLFMGKYFLKAFVDRHTVC
jgi:hypothetical protein